MRTFGGVHSYTYCREYDRRMKRQIGILGTTARIIIGTWLLGSVVYGHLVRGPFRPLPSVIGLIIFPAIFIPWQYSRAPQSRSASGNQPYRYRTQCRNLFRLLFHLCLRTFNWLYERRGIDFLRPVDAPSSAAWLWWM